MRIALVYDCLYPNTVGGAERWLRTLAETLRSDHEVTYVTRRQWDGDESPIDGVECVAVAPGGSLYTSAGRRRLWPPLRFAMGVLVHFANRRDCYDVVHCLSYPYLPALAIRLALAGTRGSRVLIEWLECLSPSWWRRYGGRIAGRAGLMLQGLCVHATREAVVFSALTARRLRETGFRGAVHRLPGLYTGEVHAAEGGTREPLVVAAGRHVPDKRMPAVVDALAMARRHRPDLRAVLVGDGPDRATVLARIEALEVDSAVSAPGFLDSREVEQLFRSASCVVSASVREGHGMVVVEAAGAGAPAVVCPAPDNAAVELVEPGVNGAVAASTDPADLATAIVDVLEAGEPLRESTSRWFRSKSEQLSVGASIRRLLEIYLSTARS